MTNCFYESIRNTPFMLNYGQHPDMPAVTALRARQLEFHKFVVCWSEQHVEASNTSTQRSSDTSNGLTKSDSRLLSSNQVIKCSSA
jgi:hypothetical protein